MGSSPTGILWLLPPGGAHGADHEGQKEFETIQAVLAGEITIEDAASILDRSVRRVFRLKRRLLTAGLSGLIHGNRSRRSPGRLPEALQNKILELVQRGSCHDINDTHLTVLLASREHICLSRERLRRFLRDAGIKAKGPKRHPKYRCRRPRKEDFGMMLQIDGSPHDWLEGRGPELTLIGALNDATNHGWGFFVPRETTWAYRPVARHLLGIRLASGPLLGQALHLPCGPQAHSPGTAQGPKTPEPVRSCYGRTRRDRHPRPLSAG